MHITIPDESVESILQDLKRAKCKGCNAIYDLMIKEKQDTLDTNVAIESKDIERINALVDSVNPGFNRFRLLAYIMEHEKKIDFDKERSWGRGDDIV